jgi:hypothetical protein
MHGTDWSRATDPRERVETLKTAMSMHKVPEGLWDGLAGYILLGHLPGHFLTAVLVNDLKEACNRADLENQYRLYDIIFFLYNCAPLQAWGSKENVEAWVARRGFVSRPEPYTEEENDAAGN